ncbi:MAG: 50S ribosomal protein L11 methyltransferase [Vicinamibacterales bacterium]
MAEARRWPSLEVRSADVDEDGALESAVLSLLHDYEPLAVHDLHPPPLPPGGIWEPGAPALDPPPTALAWRIAFAEASTRDAARHALGAIVPALSVTPLELGDDDWVARSQRALRAIEAGRFVVAPPWDVPGELAPGRTLIVIDPSMGFGTGHHQTTRLCLAALGETDVAGRAVLDVGTGSGVLAMAASFLGAREVRAVDIDPDALDAARRSAALNALPTPIDFSTADVLGAPSAAADVVLANLTGALLVRAASALAGLVAPGGTLIVSGFVAAERAAVEQAFPDLAVAARPSEDEWGAAVLRRDAPSAT